MSMEIVGGNPADIDSGLSEFDKYICVDMEFSDRCVWQGRLLDLSHDFDNATVDEIVCLREHSCCRSRLAHFMALGPFAESKEEAARRIVKYFIDPQGGQEHFDFYVDQSVSYKNIFPTWFLQKECMPQNLFELYDEHLRHPNDHILFAADVQAINRHVSHCNRCKSLLAELPTVAAQLLELFQRREEYVH